MLAPAVIITPTYCMLNIVLNAPEIPHNTGAAGRLSLATGARLHLIKPLGFSLDDRQVRRVGLDYWPDVDLRRLSCFWFRDQRLTRELIGAK